MTLPSVSLRAARRIIAVAVVLDLVALLVLSVHRQTVTRTTATRVAPAQLAAPVRVSPTLVGAAPPLTLPVQPASPGRPAPNRPTATPARERVVVPPPPKPTPPPPPVDSDDPVLTAAKCPITITKTPPPQGGLQSLISLAPAFGEFSSEAFAMASAYQPVLQLLGPILAKYPEIAPKLAPVVTPFVSLFTVGANLVFTLLGPLYSPYRAKVLNAETKLAAALAPYAKKLVDSPLGGCLLQLETALVADVHAPAG